MIEMKQQQQPSCSSRISLRGTALCDSHTEQHSAIATQKTEWHGQSVTAAFFFGVLLYDLLQHVSAS